jgi:hypothetical protein
MLVLRDDAKREYTYGLPKGYVRFGSKADIGLANRNVRLVPTADIATSPVISPSLRRSLGHSFGCDVGAMTPAHSAGTHNQQEPRQRSAG